eukprot:Gb_07240 [translate_table: standard]
MAMAGSANSIEVMKMLLSWFFGLGGYILLMAMSFGSSFGSAERNLKGVQFSYASFESAMGLKAIGNASIEDGMLQLTSNKSGAGVAQSAGRVLRSEPVKMWDRSTGLIASFTTKFNFSVHVFNPESYGDGFAFGLFPNQIMPNNSQGEYLGLYDPNAAKPYYVVGIEFDLFKNELFDPDSNHVGLDINNVSSACTSVLINYGVRLKAGNPINVQIDYNGKTRLISVYVINASLGDPLNNLVLSCNVNLSKFVKEDVYVGFSAATGGSEELHTIYSWSFQTSWGSDDRKLRKNILGISLGVSSFALALIIAGFIVFLFVRRKLRRNKRLTRMFRPVSYDKTNPSSDLSKEIIRACDWDVFPRKFSYEALRHATNNFDPTKLLGEGGFGNVYKGMIYNENLWRPVAVKRFSQGSNQSDREYLAEVAIIGRLRHRNLVQLQGSCHDRGELLLVYDYMPNGSVDQLLYDEVQPGKSVLDWSKRLKICRGLAAALLYLHEECQHTVVHRDIKTSNIMVDSEFEARLGDFGLARFIENYTNASLTTSIGGTLGYIAPERTVTGKATLESDVFSYGAVLLEIACGRRPVDMNVRDEESVLVEWVWKLHKEEKLLDAADSKLGGVFNVEEMERVLIVGLLCSNPDPEARPSIRQALRILNYEAPLPPLPEEKPFPFYGQSIPGFAVWGEKAKAATSISKEEGFHRTCNSMEYASTTDVSMRSLSFASS